MQTFGLQLMTTALDDIGLLQRWSDGNAQAGQDLLARHFDALCRFFRNKLPDAVDDLIQRTFLKLLENRSRFEGRSSFRTYLFTIARSELFDELRRRHRLGNRFEPLEHSCASWQPNATSALARRREERLLLEALRRIPIDHQIALELYFWEEMSAAEIGRILETPEGTVRTRIRRAKQLLETELNELSADGEPLHTTAARIETWAKDVRDRLAG